MCMLKIDLLVTNILIYAWVLCLSVLSDDGSCMLLKHWKDSSYLASVCETFDMLEIPIHSGTFKPLPMFH